VLERSAAAHMSVDAFDLTMLPFYDGDLEAEGDPGSVIALKGALDAAEMVFVVTPEYNGGMPAVLKNAIDWASRPPKPQAWDQKPVAILGTSPGRSGTVEAQRALRACLSRLNAFVMPQPRFLLAGAERVFDSDLKLADPKTSEFLATFLGAAHAWARRF